MTHPDVPRRLSTTVRIGPAGALRRPRAGSSDRRVDAENLGIDAHLQDLEAIIAAVGEGPVALLGYYHSVPTAIAFAADHPELVSRLVLFGGAARLRDAMSPAQTQALLSLVDQDWGLFAESAAHA